MRALFVRTSGQPAIVADLPTPSPASGDVLIRVKAAGLNPFDNHIASGALEHFIDHRYPLVLGRDVSGTVEAVGDQTHGFAVGDDVLGHVPFAAPFEVGTIAEVVVLPVSQVALKPGGLDFVSAAALPLAGGAARALVDGVDPKAGQVVLVNGASGGVGRVVVQLLARCGVTVIATASPATAGRVGELGATHVIDYTTGSVAEKVLSLYPEGVDALINLTGWTLDAVPVAAIRAGGVVRTVTQIPDDATIVARGLTGGQIMASPDGRVLAALAEQAAAGELQIDVVSVISLDTARSGLDSIETGNAHGKVVVDLTL